MNIAVVLVAVLAALFALAFFTRRRFGILGLALAAGSILSELWSKDLTPFIRQIGLEIVSPPLVSVVAAALVLLPAVILFFHGPAYKNGYIRFVGAGAFALLALAFLLPILGDALVLTGDGRKVYDFVVTYRAWIVTGGIILALFDIVASRSKRAEH